LIVFAVTFRLDRFLFLCFLSHLVRKLHSFLVLSGIPPPKVSTLSQVESNQGHCPFFFFLPISNFPPVPTPSHPISFFHCTKLGSFQGPHSFLPLPPLFPVKFRKPPQGRWRSETFWPLSQGPFILLNHHMRFAQGAVRPFLFRLPLSSMFPRNLTKRRVPPPHPKNQAKRLFPP